MSDRAPQRDDDLRDARVRAEIDRQVGARIMEYRRLLGMSRQAMSARIGISMGQLHKYETAVNRISAGMLHKIAGALGVEVPALFQQPVVVPNGVELQGERRLRALLADVVAVRDPHQRDAIFTLARAFCRYDQTAEATDDPEPAAAPPEPETPPVRGRLATGGPARVLKSPRLATTRPPVPQPPGGETL